MAKRVVNYVVLIDDLDGTELARGEGQTIRYGWKGTEYEIDLSDQHADELDRMMGNLVSKSVKVGRMLPHRPNTPKRPAIEKPKEDDTPDEIPALTSQGVSRKTLMIRTRDFRKEIRAWARENGWPNMSPTGRIPEDARQAWDAAHPDRLAPPETAGWH